MYLRGWRMSGAVPEFRLLGPVQVYADGRLVDVGAPRQRCVLAVLLLEANRMVSADQLLERVWGDGPFPDHPRAAVQVYVSLLRRALAGVDGVAIARHSGGYLIDVDERHVDVHEFEALINQARATRQEANAIAAFERALTLWRGEALSGLDTPWINAARATLDKEREAAERDLTDLQLQQGQHGVLLARLSAWAEQHPLDERLAGQLMLALYRSGRQAGALHHFRQLREHLAAELGADPSPALQRLHQQLLAGDPALVLSPPVQGEDSPDAAEPAPGTRVAAAWTEMQFRLIGPVEIYSAGQVIEVGSPQQRLVAAALAVDAGLLVSVESLIDRVWDDPPAGARRTLHVLISKMRRTLEHASRREAEEVTVVRRSGGYVLQLSPERVDLLRFRRLADDAHQADEPARATLLRAAVALWRGEPLAGLPGDWASRARAAWRQEYLQAAVAWAHAELRAGDPAATIGTLTMLAEEHPLAEPVSAALMQALCAVRRPADALARYARARQQLADELGVDPGPALQAAYAAALRATSHPPDAVTVAPGLVTASPGLPAEDQAGQHIAAVPQQLPAVPRLFKGRAPELASLTAAFSGSEEATQVAVIAGTAGVGKTWLALHWAHRHAGDFPDGQLWVNLRGFDPSEPPVDTETALRTLLDALGVPPAAVPATVAAQTGLYRSAAAGKRILVVLDNARDTSQVAPLLPGSPDCRVIITSRRQLPCIVTAHAALTLNLEGLSSGEARDLLAGHLGASRPAAEPTATAALLSYCAGLPLAISIVAAQAKAHPQFSLADLAASLAEAQTRLDGLDTGEPAASVRSALSWSHHALPPDAAALFLLLGLAPGPDISLPAAASLTAMATGQARAALRELEYANLLHQHLPGRYHMHDLIALYALEQARHSLPAAEQSAAVRRVTDYYLHTAATGERLLSTPRDAVSLGPPAPGCVPGHLPGQDAALAWFRAEYPCLLAAQQAAAARGWHDTTWQLAWTTETFHKYQGNLHNWAAAWRTALAAADHLAQPAIQALTRRCLAQACFRTGQPAEALNHLSRALSLAENAGDRLSQAHIHRMYTQAWEVQGDWHQALSHATTAMRLYSELGFPRWEADALGFAGWCHGHLGENASARAAMQEALDLFIKLGDRHGQANEEDGLGYVALDAGDYTQAVRHYATSLTLWRGLGHSHGEADALAGLAIAYTALGDQHNATRTSRQALALFRDQRRPAEATQLQQDLLNRAGPATEPDTGKGADSHPAVNNPLGKPP
jgi:DNA-binding SARP family transcriptional activator/tetratricopeptide (TPR) repeat protein